VALRVSPQRIKDRYNVFLETLRCAGLKGELYSVDKTTRHVSFADALISSSGTCIDSGIGLRVNEHNRWGYCSATGWNDTDVDELIQYAKASARMAGEGVPAETLQNPCRQPSVHLTSPGFSQLTLTKMAEFGTTCIDHAKQVNPALRLNLRLETTSRVVGFVDICENYSECTHDVCHLQLKVACPSARGYLVSHRDFYSGDSTGHDPASLVQEVVAPLRFAVRKEPLVFGRMNVMLMPNAFAAVLSMLTCLWNGQICSDGLSPFASRVNDRISNAKITLRDDGTLPGGRWSCAFDAQGTLSQDTVLVQSGVLSGFLHDQHSGYRSGESSTGNARSEFVERPCVETTNLIVEPGHHSVADALRLMRDGLIVYEVMQGSITNVLAGDFAAKVMLGHRVCDGEVAGCLDESVQIRGNLVDVLWHVTALGDFIQPWRWYYTPFVVFDGLTVTADT
jgi:PmbA protein